MDRLGRFTPEQVEAEFKSFDADFGNLALGVQFTALRRMVKVLQDQFDDTAIRAGVVERVVMRDLKIKPVIHLGAMAEVVEVFLARGEKAASLGLIDAMRKKIDAFRWQPDEILPQLARIARLRALAGEANWARSVAESAMAMYDKERNNIIDIYRAETLRSLAMAWYAIGEKQMADDVIAMALAEALENKNSRPRCDDLVETCVDMARHAVQPTEKLMSQMRDIRAALADPW
jgi:hypothetical protein